MKRKSVGVVALAVLAAIAPALTAAAADLASPAAPRGPASDWSGFYFGGNFGGAWARNNAIFVFPGGGLFSNIDPVTGSTGGSATIGGIQEGINWQFARTWVVGIEGDWSFTEAGRGFSRGLTIAGAAIPFSSGSGNLSSKLDWLASARNRLGYLAMPNVMVYGTGGAAWGKTSDAGALSFRDIAGSTYNSNIAFNSVSAGWVAGGGLEWMLADHWLLRGEYLYYHLSSGQSRNVVNPFIGPCLAMGLCQQEALAYSWTNTTVNVVRAALSYRF